MVPSPNVGEPLPSGETSVLKLGTFDLEGRLVAVHEFRAPYVENVYCLSRFTPSGAVDASFLSGFGSYAPGRPPLLPHNCVGWTDGELTMSIPRLLPLAGGALLMTQGGYNRVGGIGWKSLVRLAADGASSEQLESCPRVFPHERCLDLMLRAVDPNGHILALAGDGYSTPGRAYETRVARLLADGTSDPTFGRDGLLPPKYVGAFALLPDGAILVASSRPRADDAGAADLVVERYRP